MTHPRRQKRVRPPDPFAVPAIALLSSHVSGRKFESGRTISKNELDRALKAIREHVDATVLQHAEHGLKGGQWKYSEVQHAAKVVAGTNECNVATDEQAELVRRGFRLAMSLVTYERNIIGANLASAAGAVYRARRDDNNVHSNRDKEIAASYLEMIKDQAKPAQAVKDLAVKHSLSERSIRRILRNVLGRSHRT